MPRMPATEHNFAHSRVADTIRLNRIGNFGSNRTNQPYNKPK